MNRFDFSPYRRSTVGFDRLFDLLERQGFAVEDNHLSSREETDAFKQEHGVETTPQTFIDGKRIGGYDDVRAHFGKKRTQTGDDTISYQPVIAIFAIADFGFDSWLLSVFRARCGCLGLLATARFGAGSVVP